MRAAYDVVERKLRDGMVEGQMHVCLRDIGRLAGGYLAAGQLTAGDCEQLGRMAVGLSKSKRLGERTWTEAVAYGRQQPIREERSDDVGAFGWTDRIPVGKQARKAAAAVPDEQPALVDAHYIEADEIPAPASDWQPGDMIRYLEAVFEPDDLVGIVAQAFHRPEDDRWLPHKGVWDRTREDLCAELRACGGDIGKVIGDPNPAAGAWVRINPLDGQGCKDANVTAFRHSLIEADDQDLGKQLALIRAMQLPCSAIVHSGGKSIHAIVRVDAANAEEYRARTDRLYAVCAASGLKVDTANRNASRLSRLPGVERNGRAQYLIGTRCGMRTWEEWEAHIEETQDDLPDPQPLQGVFFDLPSLAPELIAGILREGHKARFTGPSKAGKSFALIELCAAIAEGRDWLGMQCRQGPVLYVNLELDPSSCFHRFAAVYRALGWEPKTISAIDVWNLRGKAMALEKLAPKLIRRAAGRGYKCVIFDPIYKLNHGDEIDAGQMARFCSQLDRICHELGCAVIDAHHHSKGDQGQKRSIDRGSGSGVFGRDPDAIMDMVELELSARRREELVHCLVEEALTAMAGRLGLDLAEIPVEARRPADAFLMALQEEFPKHAAEAAAATFEARTMAARLTGWRMEATLREFAAPEPRRLWFRHPVHVADRWELLTDAKAAGEAPPWEAQREAKEERAQAERRAKVEALEKAVEACGGVGHATVKDVAQSTGWGADTVRRWTRKSGSFSIRHGVIEEDDGGDDED